MLLFRDEEHVQRWCRQWNVAKGSVMSLDVAWRLALAWFSEDRGAPEWKRPPVERVETLFASLGLHEDFWRLR